MRIHDEFLISGHAADAMIRSIFTNLLMDSFATDNPVIILEAIKHTLSCPVGALALTCLRGSYFLEF